MGKLIYISNVSLDGYTEEICSARSPGISPCSRGSVSASTARSVDASANDRTANSDGTGVPSCTWLADEMEQRGREGRRAPL